MYICRQNMKKTLLLAAALSAALTLSAQEIRTNYRSEGMTHVSTEFETCGDLVIRVERVGFPDGSALDLLYIDRFQKTAVTAPRGVKMTATLPGGKFIRAEQIGRDSATKPRLENGLFLNRLKYALEPSDLETMARGVTSLELVTGWDPDDYTSINFEDGSFSDLLRRHLDAIAKAAETTIDLTNEAAGYANQTGSILTSATPLVAQGESFPFFVALSHLYYKNSAREDIDLAIQIGTEDEYPVHPDAKVTFVLKDGTELTLPQTRDDVNFIYVFPTLDQIRSLAYAGVASLRVETEKGTLKDAFSNNAFSEAVNQQYQLLMSLSAR